MNEFIEIINQKWPSSADYEQDDDIYDYAPDDDQEQFGNKINSNSSKNSISIHNNFFFILLKFLSFSYQTNLLSSLSKRNQLFTTKLHHSTRKQEKETKEHNF